MKIVVIGGTGLIGSKVVTNLRIMGHEAIPASPGTGVNTITGEGLAEVLTGAEVVIDVANSPSFEDAAALEFFQKAGTNLLAAEQAAGIKHHIALSVVGTERLQASGYFRAKMLQEQLIEASPVPYTILRSTQFFPFVSGIVKSGAADGAIHLSSALVQPISADDVAEAAQDDDGHHQQRVGEGEVVRRHEARDHPVQAAGDAGQEVAQGEGDHLPACDVQAGG